MAAIMFDTHAFVKELTQAGMPEQQAEVLARSQTTLIDEKLATKEDLKKLELATKRDLKELELATKRDLKELEQAMKTDLKELEQAMKTDLKELELRLTLRLGSMIVIAIGVVAAAGQTTVNLGHASTPDNLTHAKELIQSARFDDAILWQIELLASIPEDDDQREHGVVPSLRYLEINFQG